MRDSFYPDWMERQDKRAAAADRVLEVAFDEGAITRDEFDKMNEDEQEAYVDSLLHEEEQREMSEAEDYYWQNNDEKYDAWKDGDR